MRQIDFWYEFASTYSYLAATRIEDAAHEKGVGVCWQPFLLGPIFKKLGWLTSPFNLQEAKGRYMWRDMERSCARFGLPFKKPDPFPQNGLLAARVALTLIDDGKRSKFSRCVFQKEFGEGADISDKAAIANILSSMDLDVEQIFAQANSESVKEALKKQVSKAQALGIFGAPFFVTVDGEMFWGNDRLEEALEWAIIVS